VREPVGWIAFTEWRAYIGVQSAYPMTQAMTYGTGQETVSAALSWAAGFLADNGIDESRLNAELLLANVMDLPRTRLLLDRRREVTAVQFRTYQEFLKRRIAHEPLQYILGETEFMGLHLEVNRGVLIPRPETELLVERALEFLRNRNMTKCAVLDVGTGSGNIAVAIAKLMPWSSITALDVSSEALDVARANGRRHGLANIRFLQCDIFADGWLAGTYDLVAANLPYIASTEFAVLEPEVRAYEPEVALTDGRDGLGGIRRLADVAPVVMAPGAELLLEIAYNQQASVREILAMAGFVEIEVHKDMADLPRVVCGRLTQGDATP
jgi:release factor glutamine methyltransferase